MVVGIVEEAAAEWGEAHPEDSCHVEIFRFGDHLFFASDECTAEPGSLVEAAALHTEASMAMSAAVNLAQSLLPRCEFQ